MRIRRATDDDVDGLLALWRDADAEPTHTDDAVSLRRLIAHDADALWVAEDEGGALVGSVVAAWDGWRGSINRLVVAPSHRRRGLGTDLLRHAERRLDAAGAVRSQAIVVEDAEAAAGFWEASGWERQERRLRFVRG